VGDITVQLFPYLNMLRCFEALFALCLSWQTQSLKYYSSRALITFVTALNLETSQLFPPLGNDSPRQVLIQKTQDILTSPVLEAFRKLDQAEQDEGPISSRKQNGALLLYPIVKIENEIVAVQSLINSGNAQSLSKAEQILSRDVYTNPKVFKKTFNMYSDNIFYSDPKQANLYLSGGTTPDTTQTEQYLFRNAALTALQNMQDDVKSLLSSTALTYDSQAIEDAVDDCREALDALHSYFERANPNDLQIARKILQNEVK